MADLYITLKNLCDSRGISLAKMCEDLGWSKSTTTELKKGRVKSLSSTKVAKIAEYFGVTVDVILGISQDNPLSAITPEELKLINRIKSMNDDEVKKISEYIDFLLSKREKNKKE